MQSGGYVLLPTGRISEMLISALRDPSGLSTGEVTRKDDLLKILEELDKTPVYSTSDLMFAGDTYKLIIEFNYTKFFRGTGEKFYSLTALTGIATDVRLVNITIQPTDYGYSYICMVAK